MYHLAHVRKFLGTRRNKFRGRKDEITAAAAATAKKQQGFLCQDDLVMLLGSKEARLLATWTMSKPGYMKVTADLIKTANRRRTA